MPGCRLIRAVATRPRTRSAAFGLEWATNRLLYRYTKGGELYRCPADRGMKVPGMETKAGPSPLPPFDSVYLWVGTSYKDNWDRWCPTFEAEKDPVRGCAGNTENYITQPSRYILFHEPPAEPYSARGALVLLLLALRA